MNINLKIWRQGSGATKGGLRAYRLENIDPNISFLEMLDILNVKLVKEKKDPVAFDHDCREGICGSCGFMINGRPHGPQKATTVCQLHMRAFNNEDNILLRCDCQMTNVPIDEGPFVFDGHFSIGNTRKESRIIESF